MKQHPAAVLFPAASIVVIVVWALSLNGWTVPAEVSAAMTALVYYAAGRVGDAITAGRVSRSPLEGTAKPVRRRR